VSGYILRHHCTGSDHSPGSHSHAIEQDRPCADPGAIFHHNPASGDPLLEHRPGNVTE
jgi:hypothetical protein